jgi:serine/threonine protein kinase/HAMP domain-containing protein
MNPIPETLNGDAIVDSPKDGTAQFSESSALIQRLQKLESIVTIERQLRRSNERLARDLRQRLSERVAEVKPHKKALAGAVDQDALGLGIDNHPGAELTTLAPERGADDILSLTLRTKSRQPAPAAPIARSHRIGTQTMPASALAAGSMLFEYRIDAVLGQGGFGMTYLATDVNLNARVAIKEYLPAEFAHRSADNSVFPLWPEDRALYQEGLDSFLVEARTLATFRHANIVRVARFFEAHHTAYAVLEYEKGTSLKQWWLKQVTLPEQELLTLLLPLLDGMAVVHESGFLHRDIKPDNIYVREENGSLVLLDFGSARETACNDPAILSNVVTPGYAPAEQYIGAEQGPWTDIYAIGATLYWLVTGAKPPPATTRIGEQDPMEPAIQAGKGRFSEEFLRAIDWALQPQAKDRPRNVESFARALFAAHSASLGLQEALHIGDVEVHQESWRVLLSSPRRLQRVLLRFWRILSRPASWPMVSKMSIAMLLTSLLPMIMTSYYNLQASVASTSQSELNSLMRIADSASARVSQLLNDSRGLAAYLGTDPDFPGLLSHPSEAGKAAVQAKLDSLVKSIPDVYPIILLNAQGLALVSSDHGVTGRNFSFRDYFKEAMQGRTYVTGMVIGSTAGAPGVYYAHPVRDATGTVIGVLVLRIKGAKFAEILNDVTKETNRHPLLIDGDGVLIYYPDSAYLYSSLMPLSAEKLKQIQSDQRFRKTTIASLDMPILAKAMVGATASGSISFHSALSSKEEVAGFAPVRAHNWVVGISESRSEFEAPAQRLFTKVLYSVIVVGIVFIVLALLFARSIVRPIERLTQAAHALKRGDYEQAHIKVTADDEIGRLARTFNVMIDVLRQRDRERGHSRSRQITKAEQNPPDVA